ncbi:MAG: T9SS type A sorting domain-containing protein [Prevotella sp.]|nr:T9SS type A sorting domain-containing protein [Prevotella sp.]
MNKKIKSLMGIVLLSVLWICLPQSVMAQEEEPIITLYTNLYKTSGSSNSCTIFIGGIKDKDYIDIDYGLGTVEQEVVPATLDPETGTWSGTSITLSVTSADVIKIYGDAENIAILNLDGCYIRQTDLSKLTNLEILYMNHNELESLDLSNIHKLKYVELSDNPINKGNLVIGDQPDLLMLEIAQTGNLDPNFKMSNYPKLKVFTCWGNPGITSLDPSQCPDLIQLSLDGTSVETLDVSHNTNLQILNISDTRIKNIDLSKNIYLREFYCKHESGSVNTDIKLTDIDVTKNVNLVRLAASGNKLTSIDVSKNTYLQHLSLTNNNLKEINLDNNVNLYQVMIANNNFGFSTLPLPKDTWEDYDYYQKNIPVQKTYAEGTVIDFSDMILREGTKTTMALYQTDETNVNPVTALDESYYSFDATTGKVTLLKATTDSVYVAFANDAFPALTLEYMPLRTNKFIVKTADEYGKETKAVTFTTSESAINFKVGVIGASATEPKTFYVDFGNGEKVACTATSEDIPATNNVSRFRLGSGEITVYMPQDEQLSALDIENINLSSIDVSTSRSMKTLRLVNTKLPSIDLGWNRSLTSLEMTGNNFGTLSLCGVNYAYQKTLLGDINLSNNNLSSVALSDNNYTLHNVNLSNNKLTEISFKDADMMETLNLSNNQLTEVNVNYCSIMTKLDISNNNVSSLVLPDACALTELHCENNAFDFTNLPQLDGLTTFTYAPQNEVSIPQMGPGVDLSAHQVERNTVYRWENNGATLTKGIDYTETNGKFNFAPSLIGSQLKCYMTNDKYAGLTLVTSTFTVAAMPTNLIGNFTTTGNNTGTLTLRSYEDNNTICIDWNGDGTDLNYYTVGTVVSTFDIETKAGANAKVYTYDTDNNLMVFNIQGIKMSDMDLSGMNELIGLTVTDAGLSSITWPQSNDFTELNIKGNNFTSLDLGTHSPKMAMIIAGNNKIETFDATPYNNIRVLSLYGNGLKSITLNNADLFQLDLAKNQLTSIDLSKVPSMNTLALTENQLETIDVSGLNGLAALYLDRNKFKFSTLPIDKGYSKYTYANQADIEVSEVDGKVDLSSEAIVNGKETVYRWFVGEPTVTKEGTLSGEELILDDEYSVVNGVTLFHIALNGLKCAMTNESFPNAVLYSSFVNVTTTGINGVTDDNESNISVEGNTITAHASNNTDVRLYDINGMLIATANTGSEGTAIFNVAKAGIYVVKSGTNTEKVAIR